MRFNNIVAVEHRCRGHGVTLVYAVVRCRSAQRSAVPARTAGGQSWVALAVLCVQLAPVKPRAGQAAWVADLRLSRANTCRFEELSKQ